MNAALLIIAQTIIIMASLVIILVDALPRWLKVVSSQRSAVGGL